MKQINLFIKRLFDFLGSLMGIGILSPILLIISITIKFSSKGPVFFKQKRLGKDGKVFNVFKFRTMVTNAENIGNGLTVKNELDNRITGIGRFLRKLSLDELPQLFNVLLGNMSLVGPRPPVTYFPYDGYQNYPEWAKKRFLMKPGITGMAQVTVRNSVPWNDRIKVDNKYIDSFSLVLDFKILLLTIKKIFSTDNIYMDV
ncbi:sugar transferase [Tetragenococcus halophilus]|uniref:sugar transferase n=1 Tax=Tetragenococcus halophilus TaxID=51669 RepID=UPI00103CF8CD|nr:sugar transferase [Tetragenococcus halophilus]NWN99604.1 sugar transferase [Tetragenococcus halophilus]